MELNLANSAAGLNPDSACRVFKDRTDIAVIALIGVVVFAAFGRSAVSIGGKSREFSRSILNSVR